MSDTSKYCHACEAFHTPETPCFKLASSAGSATCPITYRDLHEEAAGMGLEAMFFAISGIEPDAPVKCNCTFDVGHEPHCDLVLANEILRRRNTERTGGSASCAASG